MNTESPREIAVRILKRHSTQQDYVEKLLEEELERHALCPPDRALCQELVYGVIRSQAALDWLIARKTTGRPQKPVLQLLLRLGLYQIFWLDRIPPHAAVHETVELAKRLGFGPQAGFLNAVLRGYTRRREETARELEKLRETDPATGYSHPAWLVERWRARWGAAGTTQLLKWNNTPATIFARLNTLKTDAPTLAAQWQQEGVRFIERQWDWTGGGLVFELQSHPPLAGCQSFQRGWFYIQDPGTLLSVSQLDPQPGETVLDLCAAPGGKSTLMAQRMKNRGRIIAQDNDMGRLRMVEENCARLGVQCVEICLADAQTNPAPNILFDKILVDAPCSNSGVLRRRVDLRGRITPKEIARLCALQGAILARAAARLKPGGTLVYSTCSLETEENEMVVRSFLDGRADFEVRAQRQLLPFVEQVDGAYVARLGN